MRSKFAFLLLFAFSFAYGQANYHIANYSLVVKGTSNLHDWQSQAKEVRAYGNLTMAGATMKSIQSLNVEIPVKTIKSEKGSIMDNKTYDALNANTYPNINYRLERVAGLNQNGANININATGYLTISGTTNRIDLYVQGKVEADGSVTFRGSKKIKMTDYKVKPPTALLGTLTTGDEVEIVFQVTLKQ